MKEKCQKFQTKEYLRALFNIVIELGKGFNQTWSEMVSVKLLKLMALWLFPILKWLLYYSNQYTVNDCFSIENKFIFGTNILFLVQIYFFGTKILQYALNTYWVQIFFTNKLSIAGIGEYIFYGWTSVKLKLAHFFK